MSENTSKQKEQDYKKPKLLQIIDMGDIVFKIYEEDEKHKKTKRKILNTSKQKEQDYRGSSGIVDLTETATKIFDEFRKNKESMKKIIDLCYGDHITFECAENIYDNSKPKPSEASL
jgi:hypothetical protein